MNSQKTSPVLRVFPSLTDVAFLMPLAFLFFRMGGATKMLEGDTGWHIRAGEWMLANGRVLDHDLFSFTKSGEQWFAWEWLWDVIFAWLHTRWGMGAVVMGSVLILSVTFAWLFRLAEHRSGNALVAAAVTLLAMAASAIHWWARPHMVTMLMAVAFVSVLEAKREGRRNLLWLLPIVMVFWTNLHGGFVAGLLIIGCYAAGELATALLTADADERTAALKRSGPYAAVGGACFAATFINPHTYHLHAHLFQYLSNPDSPFFRWVGEWQSVSFHHSGGRYFEIMFLWAIGSAVWMTVQKRFVYPLLVVGWLHLALVSARHIPIFAIVAAPIAAQATVEVLAVLKRSSVASWVKKSVGLVEEVASEIRTFESVPRLHLVSAGGFVLALLLVLAPTPPERFVAEYDPETYPVEAVDALRAELTGNVFAQDEWSDYLIYRLYPSTRVYVDGRFDFYGSEHTEEYLDLMSGKKDWDTKLEKHGITKVLLSAKDPLASTLSESSNWTSVYEDELAILFLASDEPTDPVDTGSIAAIGGAGGGSFRAAGADSCGQLQTKTSI